MVDIVQLGYEVDTAQVLKGDAALDDLTASTLNADKATKTLAKTSTATGAVLGKTAAQTANLNRASFLAGGGARMLSLQLSQVAQQGAATGNFVQALSIQAADIGILFGGIGIAAGALISVLGPTAVAFFRNADGADDLDSALDRLDETVGRLNAPLDVLNTELDELISQYGDATVVTLQFARAQARLEAGQAARRFEGEVSILDDLISRYTAYTEVTGNLTEGALGSINADQRRLSETLQLIAKDFQVSEEAAMSLQVAFREFETAKGFEAQEVALTNIITLLEDSDAALEELPEELGRAISEMITMRRETELARNLMEELAGAAAGVTVGDARALDIFGGNLLPDDPGSPEDRPARSRGGSRSDPFEGNLNRLVQSLETERETLERWYAESQTLLEDRRALEFLTEQEHKEALLDLDREYYARQAEIAREAAQVEVEARTNALNAIGGLLGSFAGESRAAAVAQIAINKGLAIAQAIQNTAVAQTRALAELGPIAGPPMAARIAAWGKVQIAAIAATGLAQAAGTGGGGVQVGATGTAATSPASDPSPRRVLIDFNGSPSWIGDMFADITSKIQEGSRDGVIYEVAR